MKRFEIDVQEGMRDKLRKVGYKLLSRNYHAATKPNPSKKAMLKKKLGEKISTLANSKMTRKGLKHDPKMAIRKSNRLASDIYIKGGGPARDYRGVSKKIPSIQNLHRKRLDLETIKKQQKALRLYYKKSNRNRIR